MMEITYQLNRKDTTAFYDYYLQKTKQGRVYSRSVFLSWRIYYISASLVLGILVWAATGNLKAGWIIALLILISVEIVNLFITTFRPRYGAALQLLQKQEKDWSPAMKENYLLPKTLKFGESTFEIYSSNALHRYRLENIEQVTLGADFLFIEMKLCDIFYVPKRSFPSEEKYLEFGNALISAWQKKTGQNSGQG